MLVLQNTNLDSLDNCPQVSTACGCPLFSIAHQTHSCLRDWHLSASWWPNWRASYCEIPIHHRTSVLRSLRGTLNYAPIILRDSSIRQPMQVFPVSKLPTKQTEKENNSKTYSSCLKRLGIRGACSRAPPKTPNTIVLWWLKGFSGLHDANRRQLSQWARYHSFIDNFLLIKSVEKAILCRAVLTLTDAYLVTSLNSISFQTSTQSFSFFLLPVSSFL